MEDECDHTLVRELLHIQHGDLDALFSEQQDDLLANAVGAARHDDDLLLPIPLIALEVVEDLVVKPAADGVEQAEGEQRLQVTESGGMLGGEQRALGRVFGSEEEREGEDGIEDGCL